MDRVGDLIKVEPHEHRAEAEAVVAMEVRDKNPCDNRGGNVGKNKLTLSAFSGIEQEPLIIPAE